MFGHANGFAGSGVWCATAVCDAGTSGSEGFPKMGAEGVPKLCKAGSLRSPSFLVAPLVEKGFAAGGSSESATGPGGFAEASSGAVFKGVVVWSTVLISRESPPDLVLPWPDSKG